MIAFATGKEDDVKTAKMKSYEVNNDAIQNETEENQIDVLGYRVLYSRQKSIFFLFSVFV